MSDPKRSEQDEAAALALDGALRAIRADGPPPSPANVEAAWWEWEESYEAQFQKEPSAHDAFRGGASWAPPGWEWHHDHQAALLLRDGWMCEAHPGLPFEHDFECPGPGMPWMVEGRAAIEALAHTAELDALNRIAAIGCSYKEPCNGGDGLTCGPCIAVFALRRAGK